MSYPLSADVVPGQPTEANQYNNLRSDALFLGGESGASGTVRDLLISAMGALVPVQSGTHAIKLTASEEQPAALMIGGVIYSVTSDLTLTLSADDLSAGKYSIFASGTASGAFTLEVTAGSRSREIGSFVWDGSGIVPGTVRTVAEAAYMRAVNSPAEASGRLSLVSGNPVPDADVTQGVELYFVPYRGNRIGIYLFGSWEYFDFSVLTMEKSGMMSGIPYDIFITADADGLSLRAVQWSSASARVSGTLQWVDGVQVSGSDPSLRYVGTVCLNESGYFEDSLTGRLVVNENNRVARPILAKLVSSKDHGAVHMNSWTPYYDEDAPRVRVLMPSGSHAFELSGVGIGSPVSESDRGYNRFWALGILQDPMTESPFTGNVSLVPIYTHSFGNGGDVVSISSSEAVQGYHNYYLGFWANYSYYADAIKAASGECPGLFGKIEA